MVESMEKRDKSSTIANRARPRIFLGSSVEGLAVARAIQSALYYEAEPVIWSQGVFGLSGGTLESLVEECDNFDFAVFVLSADDLVIKKKQREIRRAPS
jgi:predicted nucleotide-binding protein